MHRHTRDVGSENVVCR